MTTKEKAQALLTLLIETYSEAFTQDIKSVRPLEIGIHTQLYDWAKAQGYSGTALRKALSLYCHRTSYLYALAERRERISMDGKPRGRVSKEHSKHAKRLLLERKKAKRLRAMQPVNPLPKLNGTRPTLSLRKSA